MSKSVVQRQRIGPQIRHLRQMHGLTLDDLAGSAGLSASHLSRLERSQTLPSFTVLANIAQVLGVSIDEFVQLEHDLQELDEQLAWQSQLLALDDNAYREIVNLSIDTRRQLNHAIEVLSNGRLTSVVIQEQASECFREDRRIEQIWPSIREMIKESGLNPVGISRALVQLLEIPGERIGFLTSPGLLSTSPSINYGDVYRALCPSLPLDPSVAQNWNNWHRMAREQFPFEWTIRIMVHRNTLDRVRERFSGSVHVDADQMVVEMARYWLGMLDSASSLELAVIDEKLIDGNILTGGNAAALFERHTGTSDSLHEPVGLWVSSHHLVEPVVNALNRTWNSLTDREKDESTVRNWLNSYAS